MISSVMGFDFLVLAAIKFKNLRYLISRHLDLVLGEWTQFVLVNELAMVGGRLKKDTLLAYAT